jgi:hypothetical protein
MWSRDVVTALNAKAAELEERVEVHTHTHTHKHTHTHTQADRAELDERVELLKTAGNLSSYILNPK